MRKKDSVEKPVQFAITNYEYYGLLFHAKNLIAFQYYKSIKFASFMYICYSWNKKVALPLLVARLNIASRHTGSFDSTG